MCWKAAGTVNRRIAPPIAPPIAPLLAPLLAPILCLLFVLGFFYTSTVAAQDGDNTPQPDVPRPLDVSPLDVSPLDVSPLVGVQDRLAAPPISDPPTLIELGHYEYYLSCMVCHGDRGQGLTEEWRNAGDPADANCWQSRCHASNYPPNGFELPRYAPPVIGEYALARFSTIGDLYSYIQLSMPWHMPGLLEDEKYRQIALFLADANGAPDLESGAESGLDWTALATRAATSRVAPEENLTDSSWAGVLFALMGIVLLVGGVVWMRKRRPG